ncbi:aromatic motif membrane protein [Metamycoplasma canadense]|nr:aromatic motif membrane protein [Metamycoplasma canadense]
MKKLFLANLPIALLPLSAISCIKQENTKIPSIDFEKKEQTKTKLYQNQFIKDMLNIFSQNDNHIKGIYISEQENISFAKYNELKYAFVFDPIFIQKSVHDHGENSFLAQTSKEIIQKTLSKDWYWTLNNITKFKFIFNPYGDRYKTFPKEKEQFNEVRNQFGSLINIIKNPEPTNLIKIPIPDIKKIQSVNDYNNKESWYLIFDNNKALKIWKYIENHKIYFQILPDLLVFKNYNNIKEMLIDLEDRIFQKRKKYFEKRYENDKEDAKWEAEDEGKEFDENKFLKQKNDKQYMEFQGIYKYNDDFVDSLNEINNESENGLKIYRFSMRFINEEN